MTNPMTEPDSTETPRTDEQVYSDCDGYGDPIPGTECVPADYARQLERELSAEREVTLSWHSKAESLDRLLFCERAEHDRAKNALTAERQARELAEARVRHLAGKLDFIEQLAWKMARACGIEAEVRAALAKETT